MILQSSKGNKMLDLRKNRFSGDLGKINLIFDKPSGRFLEFNQATSQGVENVVRKEVEPAPAKAAAPKRRGRPPTTT